MAITLTTLLFLAMAGMALAHLAQGAASDLIGSDHDCDVRQLFSTPEGIKLG